MSRPSQEELQRLFIAADKAGNEDDARFFLSMLDEQAPKNPGSWKQQAAYGAIRSLDKTGRGFVDFNLGIVDAVTGGWEAPERARAALKEGSRERERQFEQNATTLSRGAETATDIGQFFIPASGAAKLTQAAPMLGRVGAQALGAMGLDAVQQQGEGQEGLDLGRTAATGVFAGGAELAAPVVGRAFNWAMGKVRSPDPVKVGREMAARLGIDPAEVTDDVAKRLFQAGDELRAGADPDSVAFEAVTGIRQSRANKTGSKSDWRAQEFLQARNNPKMTQFAEGQRADLEQFAGRITGGLDSPQTAVDDVQQAVRAARNTAKAGESQAWQFARNSDLVVSGQLADDFSRNVTDALRSEGRIVTEKIAGPARSAIDEIDGVLRTAVDETGQIDFKKIEEARKMFSTNYRAMSDSSSKAAFRIAREQFDRSLDDLTEATIISGNIGDIQNLKKAIGISREVHQRFSAAGAKDRVGKMVERMVEDDNLDELTGFILGTEAISKTATANAAKAIKRALGDQPEVMANFKNAVLFKALTDRSGKVSGPQAIAGNLRKMMTSRRELLNELFTKNEISQLDFLTRGFDRMTNPFKSSGTGERLEAFRAYTQGLPIANQIWQIADAVGSRSLANRATGSLATAPTAPLLPAAAATQPNRQ